VVVDRRNEQVLVYDKSGNYISKVHRKGRGPGEYLNMTEAFIDDQNRVIILDYWENKVYYYTFAGEHLRTIESFSDKTIVRTMVNTRDGNFICYDFVHDPGVNYIGDVWRVDSLGNRGEVLINTGMVHPDITYILPQYLYYLPNGNIGFMCMEDEANYEIDSDGVKPYLQFVVKGKTLENFTGVRNPEYISNGLEPFTVRWWTQHKNNYVFSGWRSERRELFWTLYDGDVMKMGKELDFRLSDDETILFNSLRYGETLFEPVMTNVPDCIITPMTGIMVWEALSTPDLPSITRKKLESLVPGMTEDEILNMNPVLQILHIK
jgi:hypothetical protein